jgi:hypothetical protein
MTRIAPGLIPAAALATVAALQLGCEPDAFDPTRDAVAQETLGQEAYEVFCQRLAFDEDPTDVSGRRWIPFCEGRSGLPDGASRRMAAFWQHTAPLRQALDTIFPDALRDPLVGLLADSLDLLDRPDAATEGRLPRHTRRLAAMVDAIAADDGALLALARIGQRQGYRPPRLALSILRPVMAYPAFDELARTALRVIAPDGAAGAEWAALLRVLALEMATAEASAPDPGPSTLSLATDLLFSDQPAFGAVRPAWVVRRDDRGLALPAPSPTGGIRMPFADTDADGRADINAAGAFVDVVGNPLVITPPFPINGPTNAGDGRRDAVGRALGDDGTPLYVYLDADTTLLAGMTREASLWMRPAEPVPIDLLRGMRPLLGPRIGRVEVHGGRRLDFQGPDLGRGAIYEMVHAIGELLHRPETDALLAVLERVLVEDEAALAGVVEVGLFLDARFDEAYADAALVPGATLFDELLQTARQMARVDGMIEAMLRALADERSLALGMVYGQLMATRDRIDYDPANINGPPLGFPLDVPVDRGRVDDFDNESLFQRSMGLIDALNGVDVCNRDGARLKMKLAEGIEVVWPVESQPPYAACELVHIENVARAYGRSVVGRFDLELNDEFINGILALAEEFTDLDIDEILVQSSGIEGLTRKPTPQALNRMVFWGTRDRADGTPNNAFVRELFDDVYTREGDLVTDRYPATIFSWELDGFYTGMAPLLEVLTDDRYEFGPNGEWFFGDLVHAAQQHWPSPASPLTQSDYPGTPHYAAKSDGRAFEALIAEALLERDLVGRLQRLLVTLDAMEVEPGVDGITVLARATEALLLPERGASQPIRTRDGRVRVPVSNGAWEVDVAPAQLLDVALDGMETAHAAEPGRSDAWVRARGALVDQLLTVNGEAAQPIFENRRFVAALRVLLPFVRAQIARHAAAGDLVTWANGLDERVADSLGGAMGTALFDLFDAVDEDTEARDAIVRFLGYLLDEAAANDAFFATVYAAVDGLQVLADDRNTVPLLRVLALGVAPNAADYAEGRDASLRVDAGVAEDLVDLVRTLDARDGQRALPAILRNFVAETGGDGRTPLEIVIDTVAEVNRTVPDARGPLSAEDWRAVLRIVSEFLTDERSGLERFYRVLQSRALSPGAR